MQPGHLAENVATVHFLSAAHATERQSIPQKGGNLPLVVALAAVELHQVHRTLDDGFGTDEFGNRTGHRGFRRTAKQLVQSAVGYPLCAFGTDANIGQLFLNILMLDDRDIKRRPFLGEIKCLKTQKRG